MLPRGNLETHPPPEKPFSTKTEMQKRVGIEIETKIEIEKSPGPAEIREGRSSIAHSPSPSSSSSPSPSSPPSSSPSSAIADQGVRNAPVHAALIFFPVTAAAARSYPCPTLALAGDAASRYGYFHADVEAGACGAHPHAALSFSPPQSPHSSSSPPHRPQTGPVIGQNTTSASVAADGSSSRRRAATHADVREVEAGGVGVRGAHVPPSGAQYGFGFGFETQAA
ncbi:hypothetical protein B0H13DRAFT_2663681 [Mycena leptocephala]|nr:hypothetical protein B0H13DRAFT_2663681 [Mycena leptocephala]